MIGYGKIILFGEHFVVHGLPAIASGLKNIKTILKIKEGPWNVDELSKQALLNITNALGISRSFSIKWVEQVPPRANLGSSAAMAVAFTRALNDMYSLGLSDEDIFKLSFEAENVFHGNPSGVDGACATYGTPIVYKERSITPIPSPNLDILIISTKKKKKTTKELVEQFATIKNNTFFSDRIFSEYLFIFENALKNINNKLKLGKLMDYNHVLLSYFNLTTPEIEEIREYVKDLGALGVKITGAGKGGNIIALFKNKKTALDAKDSLPWTSYYSKI